MTISTPIAQITATGITAPSYADILAYFQAQFQAIYGSDAYIAPDSQDGQWLAVLASATHDMNQMMVAAYQSYSPTFAQGAGLSSVVKINGLQRQAPSFSTAVGNIVGVNGTSITNGVVQDANGNLWNVPGTVVIPGGGSIAVTVVAQQAGAIAAPAGTINKINTPTLGWQSFASTSDAVPGAPVETDAALRRRQATAASLPSQSPLAGVAAAVANLAGVVRVKCYENTGNAPDGNGLPAHSISVVVEGGDVNAVAATIGQKKTPGAATYGTTSINYTDPLTGIAYTINFFELAFSAMTVIVTGAKGVGYNTNIGTEIAQSIANYVASLDVGQTVQFFKLAAAATLPGNADGGTYDISAITLNGGAVDVPVAFNHLATCDPVANVTINIT